MTRRCAPLGRILVFKLAIPATVPTGALGPHTPDLANGATMFLIGGCSSCHAVPKQEDSTRLGGGLGLDSPFGTFYVPNISPDTKDGIGGWTDAQFITAMTKGTRCQIPQQERFRLVVIDGFADCLPGLSSVTTVMGGHLILAKAITKGSPPERPFTASTKRDRPP